MYLFRAMLGSGGSVVHRMHACMSQRGCICINGYNNAGDSAVTRSSAADDSSHVEVEEEASSVYLAASRPEKKCLPRWTLRLTHQNTALFIPSVISSFRARGTAKSKRRTLIRFDDWISKSGGIPSLLHSIYRRPKRGTNDLSVSRIRKHAFSDPIAY